MFTGIVFVIVIILFVIFYKRDMLSRMLSLNVAAPANELQVQLEKTADTVIKQLENHIGHLELLLQEADEKIALLDKKITLADRFLENNPGKPDKVPAVSPCIDIRLPTEVGVNLEPAELSHVMTEWPNTPREDVHNGRHKLVLTMSEQGYSVTEIAKATGMGKGEIMLLIQLNKK